MFKIKKISYVIIVLLIITFFSGCTKKITKQEYIEEQIKITEQIKPISKEINYAYSNYLSNTINKQDFIKKIKICKEQYIKNEKSINELDKKEKLSKDELNCLNNLISSRKNLYLILENSFNNGELKSKEEILKIYISQMNIIQKNMNCFKYYYNKI